jgi:HTH-type transcriptional regulator, sugar sensing transcriptional regulator
MLSTQLEELGLSKVEAKVYLTVLELGASFVSAISKRSGVPRVNCYYALGSMVGKGIMSCFTQNNLKYYSVESPKILINKQEEKLQKVKKLLPELLSITNALAYKPKIQYYEGIEGIKNIFEDTLTSSGELLGYTNLKELPKVVSPEFLKNYAERKINKKIKTRMLSPTSDEAKNYLENNYPKNFNKDLVEIFFVHPKEYIFDYEITIYNDKTSLVSLNPSELMGIIIESSLYAKTQRSVFNLAWLGATSFVVR